MWQSFKDTVMENWGKILLIGGIVGFFSYEIFDRIAKSKSGCIVTIQPKNDEEISQCKIYSLTCEPTLKIGSRCPHKYPIYNKPLPELPTGIVAYGTPSATTPSATTPSTTPSADKIGLPSASSVCGSKIGKDNTCSALCDSKYLISDDSNNTYEYTCAELNALDALADFGDKMLDAVGDIVDGKGLKDIFDSIKKWTVIFIFVVIGILIFSKLIPFILHSKEPSHEFRSVRFRT